VSRRLIFIGVLTLLEMIWLVAGMVSAADTPDYEAYFAQQGQTVAQIAAEYGIAAAYLAQYNRLGMHDALPAGQIVLIPSIPRAAVTSTAGAGDGTGFTPDGNSVRGKLGAIIADRATLTAQPGKGTVLFQDAPRGTELLVIGETPDHFAVLMSDGSTGFVARKAVGLTEREMTVPKPTPPPAPPKPAGRPELIATAYEYLGTRYKLGGRLPDSVDCSLLVQTVFRRHGITLPRTAAQQYRVGQPVAVSELLPGDRLYFYGRGGSIGHTGLYMGDGQFIHASSNRGAVGVDYLGDDRYWKKYAGARR